MRIAEIASIFVSMLFVVLFIACCGCFIQESWNIVANKIDGIRELSFVEALVIFFTIRLMFLYPSTRGSSD